MNVSHKNVNFVVLAGGSGKRLWPLSRSNNPKQFLCIEDKKTLLESTIARIKSGFYDSNIHVVCAKEHEAKVVQIIKNENIKVFCEPKSCNTAAAMLYSVMNLNNKSNNLVAFVPSDHHICDEQKFCDAIAKAFSIAETDESLVLIGIKPKYPATNYGYISYQNDSVTKFHEKPTKEKAEQYLQQDDILWNSGILIGKASSFLNAYKSISPEFYNKMKSYFENNTEYDLPNISTDYLILEKLQNLKVIKADFQWSDLGTLDLFLAAKKIDSKNKIIQIDSKNNIINVQNKLTVLVDVENLCIVDTGDVLLVTSNQKIQKINEVVDQLQKSNLKEFC
ncbi:sugar phosphate nucleotidyltransferase [Candidatus Dependentiae bacterium]|nr:sugar phosphate nucleotidyltransferase [Candidatus Dependentiae bacterium]